MDSNRWICVILLATLPYNKAPWQISHHSVSMLIEKMYWRREFKNFKILSFRITSKMSNGKITNKFKTTFKISKVRLKSKGIKQFKREMNLWSTLILSTMEVLCWRGTSTTDMEVHWAVPALNRHYIFQMLINNRNNVEIVWFFTRKILDISLIPFM